MISEKKSGVGRPQADSRKNHERDSLRPEKDVLGQTRRENRDLMQSVGGDSRNGKYGDLGEILEGIASNI
jgi:hypothetical protein